MELEVQSRPRILPRRRKQEAQSGHRRHCHRLALLARHPRPVCRRKRPRRSAHRLRRLILEIWTDGRITPDDALTQASAILQHHLDVFVGYDKNAVEFEEVVQAGRGKDQAQEAAQHERQRDRAERPRRQLLEQREHHHGRPAWR